LDKYTVDDPFIQHHYNSAVVFYLSIAVNIIWVFLLTGVQRHMGNVLYWVGQGQQNLTLLYLKKIQQLLTKVKRSVTSSKKCNQAYGVSLFILFYIEHIFIQVFQHEPSLPSYDAG